MIEVRIEPQWDLRSDDGERLDRHCLPLLLAIEACGRLRPAAAQIGLSYRHAWNLLKRWEELFGAPLVELERGRGARLSALGRRMVRAEQRIRARLMPQLMSLAAEVETEINRALQGPSPVLRLHASHGFAVAKLREHLERHREVRWELQFRGGIDAVAALAQRNCEVAGFHVPCGPLGEAGLERYRPWLDDAQCVLPFVIRRQGLMLPAGNPAGITSLRDLASRRLRFVNRQAGSGTRELLDQLLADGGISTVGFTGFQHEEFTHSAVAAFVASGMADVGFGVEAAAREFGLDFVPVAEEYYSLLCWREMIDTGPMRDLLALFGNSTFQGEINAMPGYRCFHAGAVWSLDEALRRWRHEAA